MKKWFPLVMVVAWAAIGTPLQAGIFDFLVNDTVEESVPLTNGGGEIVLSSPEIQAPAPMMGHGYTDHGYTDHGPSQSSGYGYPFKTSCCESQTPCVGDLWRGYCGKSRGACHLMHSRFGKSAHGKGGCGKGGCGKGGCGTGGCATGKCGHGGLAFGKGFGHVQQSFFPQKSHVQHGHVQQSYVPQKSHVQRSHVQRSHVQRSFVQRSFGHARHGKGFSGCDTCGQTPCGCHAKGHHQKGFGFHGKSFGTHAFGKGHVAGGCGCGTAAHGKGMKSHCRLGLFSRQHHCGTCGKSTGFGKGGCGCGTTKGKGGWSQEGSVIWDKGHSFDAPQHGQPTPAYDPPIDLEIPAVPQTDTLPVPPTPTAHSASIRRLPPVTGYQY